MREDFYDDDDEPAEFQPWVAVAVIAFISGFWLCVFVLIRWLVTS